MFVGNNWDGTADVIRSTGDFAGIGRIDVVPDRAERMAEINADPIKWIYFQAIRNGVGEGHDQLVDDMYSTPDGASVVVSRPSFADVVSVDLATGDINWRFPVSGYRSDHMAVSPDGTRVAVSASTSNTVHVLDIQTGEQVGSFATGDKPHENIFTGDGRYIWNMSIGEVNTALDAPWLDWTKGDRHIRSWTRGRTGRSRSSTCGSGSTRSAWGPLGRGAARGVLARRVQAVLPGLVLQRLLRRRRHRPDHPDQDPADAPERGRRCGGTEGQQVAGRLRGGVGGTQPQGVSSVAEPESTEP
ncbi:YncE family protein OS=Streptomyces tendae OX=1932 GN=GUR47_04710 PE=4 SV=1 [Streptomyces tendae]